jgi:UDP-glucose 4-epimerase
MRCIVTGSDGFIGSHLVEQLQRDGHRVRGLDSARGIDLAADTVPVRYFRGIDWVFHLAGASDIIPSIVRPADYHRANVTATVNVLEACRRAGIKKFIYAASSTCYGKNPPIPTRETAPIAPQFPYALTKYIGELYALHYAHVYALPVISLRLFNVYGPRVRATADYGPVLSTFMAQKLAGRPFTVVGDGGQKRDFTFVRDVVDAMIIAAGSCVSGEVFNVGTGNPQTVNRLVELLGGGRVVHIPKRPGEPDTTHADIAKIQQMLGWKPKVSFEEGIAQVLLHRNDWSRARVFTPAMIKRATRDWFCYLEP